MTCYVNHHLYDEDSDLIEACEYNNIQHDDLREITLVIEGERDYEAEWHWIVKTGSGYAYIHGNCDYTGWSCVSDAERFDAADLPGALALTDQDVRRRFENMLASGISRS